MREKLVLLEKSLSYVCNIVELGILVHVYILNGKKKVTPFNKGRRMRKIQG